MDKNWRIENDTKTNNKFVIFSKINEILNFCIKNILKKHPIKREVTYVKRLYYQQFIMKQVMTKIMKKSSFSKS